MEDLTRLINSLADIEHSNVESNRQTEALKMCVAGMKKEFKKGQDQNFSALREMEKMWYHLGERYLIEREEVEQEIREFLKLDDQWWRHGKQLCRDLKAYEERKDQARLEKVFSEAEESVFMNLNQELADLAAQNKQLMIKYEQNVKSAGEIEEATRELQQSYQITLDSSLSAHEAQVKVLMEEIRVLRAKGNPIVQQKYTEDCEAIQNAHDRQAADLNEQLAKLDRKLVEVNERWAHHEADLKQQQNDVVELSSPADSSGSTLQFESDEVQVVADSQPQAGISTSAFSVPIQRRKLFNPKANAFKEECEMV